jgi:hypothetical protein
MDTGVDCRIRAAESLVQAKREPEREAHLISMAESPAGLSPAEHACLTWTHNRTGGFPASGSRTGPHAFSHGTSLPSAVGRASPKHS